MKDCVTSPTPRPAEETAPGSTPEEPTGSEGAKPSYITRAEAAKLEEDILNQVRSYSDKGRARAEKALQELIQEVAQMTG